MSTSRKPPSTRKGREQGNLAHKAVDRKQTYTKSSRKGNKHWRWAPGNSEDGLGYAWDEETKREHEQRHDTYKTSPKQQADRPAARRKNCVPSPFSALFCRFCLVILSFAFEVWRFATVPLFPELLSNQIYGMWMETSLKKGPEPKPYRSELTPKHFQPNVRLPISCFRRAPVKGLLLHNNW